MVQYYVGCFCFVCFCFGCIGDGVYIGFEYGLFDFVFGQIGVGGGLDFVEWYCGGIYDLFGLCYVGFDCVVDGCVVCL